MEQLHNGFSLEFSEGTFPLSTDSILLSQFVRLPKQAKVLDLGSGCGTIGTLLCANDPLCQVTGIELNPKAHDAAVKNIQRNGLDHRLFSICADLRTIPSFISPGSFNCCVSNPPYFTGGPVSQHTPDARRDHNCSLAALFKAAAWAVQYGKDFCLVHRPEKLGEIIACAAAVHLEPKRLCLVRHKENGPVNLILLSCRKGAKSGLQWEEISLFHPDGTPTKIYQEIYHL